MRSNGAIAPAFDPRFVRLQDLEWWLRASRVARVGTVPRVGYLIRRDRAPGEAPRHSRQDEPYRIGWKLPLLQEHAAYFRDHPKSAARQWRGVGRAALDRGDARLARRALLLRVSLRPKDLRRIGELERLTALAPEL